MKRARMLVIFSMILLIFISMSSSGQCRDESRDRITVSGAWALYPMMVKWADEYRKVNPIVTIDVSAGGAGKGVADALAGMADLGMVSREINAEEKAKGLWHVSVVKDAVVPVLNVGNPAADGLLNRGLTVEEFRRIWIEGNVSNWKEVVPGLDIPLNVYTRSDACGAAETWAVYLGGAQADLKGVGIFGDPGLCQAVIKDAQGVGYGNINYVYNFRTKKPNEGLAVIPLDLNRDGRIDADEKMYDTLDNLVKAIGEGKFPSPPARGLHLVSKGIPQRECVRRFLSWVLKDGQEFVAEAGFVRLPAPFIAEQEKRLIH